MSTSKPKRNKPAYSKSKNILSSKESEKQSNGYSKHRPSYFTPKIKFTLHEDMLLYNAVQNHGTDDWRLISSKVPGRNPRQCRERWNNYLNPSLISTPWTPEEDYLLMKKYKELGSHWCAIASFFSSRSTNSVKNRFVILKRKQNKEKKTKKEKDHSIVRTNKTNLVTNSTKLTMESSIINIRLQNNVHVNENNNQNEKVDDPFDFFNDVSIDWLDFI